jgi:hypothetical protein
MRDVRLWLAFVAAVAFGCGDDGAAGTDAGDAGSMPGDGGGAVDAATDPDGGSPRDGGADGGSSDDAGINEVCEADMDLGSETGIELTTGDTSDGSDDFTPLPSEDSSCPATSQAADMALLWQAPSSDTFVIDTNGSSYDTTLHLRDASCTPISGGCNDDGGDGLRSRVEVELEQGEQIYIIVDGYSDNSGMFQLSITDQTEETACDDGMDNDRDGDTDCDDQECKESNPEMCVESMCDDDMDNDGDGDTDCDDSDCEDVEPCAETQCDDDMDNDGDGDVDCADFDCADKDFCTESNCTDGIDNEEDGLVDCMDPDCNADPACEETNCTDDMDNEGDGLVDCMDPDCETDPACQETICAEGTDKEAIDCCSDGIDNEGDGLIDCADFDCDGSGACGESMCDDDTDNDGDGHTDCEDSECRCDLACADDPCPDQDIGSETGDMVATGTLELGSCSYRMPMIVENECDIGTPGEGPEVTLRWTAPSAGSYKFDTRGSEFDTVLYLRESCQGSQLTCNDDIETGMLRSETSASLQADQTVIIIVDGWSPREAGDWVLNITAN